MSEKQSRPRQVSGLRISPVALIRLCSILVVMLMLGHMSAYPWASAHDLQEAQLVGSMKTVNFEFMGEHSTYWNLYYGWGILVAVLLLALAIILWLVSDLAVIAPRRVGIMTGFLSATCLTGACLSLLYFYLPPTILFAVIFFILLATTVQLLRQQPGFDLPVASTSGSQQAGAFLREFQVDPTTGIAKGKRNESLRNMFGIR